MRIEHRNSSSGHADTGSTKGLAFCAGLLVGSLLGSATAQWSEREGLLMAAFAIMAVIVFLLLKRHEISDERLATERRNLMTAVNNIPQGLVLYDASARIIICNRPYIEMFGLSPDVAKPGCTMHRLIAHRQETGSFDGDVDDFCDAIMGNVKLGRATRQLTQAPGGRAIEIVNKPLPEGGWVATIQDITERTRTENKIAHMAHYDALTDLPNRVLFRERLERALRAIRPDQQLAVMYIDIDEFKAVNDALGHQIGDELLRAIADRLRTCVGDTDVAARLGGDEFAVIQTVVRDQTETMQLLAAIYQAIRRPIDCSGHLITTDASIGIAVAPADGLDIDQLLRNADLALYGAKSDGRRTYRFFETGMDARAKARRSLELELRQAIADGSFELHYQPLLHLEEGQVSCCEALVRWRHPERGTISPADFIPIAEDTGLINDLGHWVLNTACREAMNWPEHVHVAVNVSPIQFKSQTLALNVAAALSATGLAPSRLELEITEAVLIRDDEAALDILHQLRELGVRIALDDFGTGYSSLSYLQRFPFDKIKIDRAFIKDLAGTGASSTIVQAVVNIAAASDMTTTAEGVETEQQRNLLRILGCTEMQGYLFSRPVSSAEIRKLLSSYRETAVSVA
ncbi:MULTISPECIES: putative bifunctional diguanylate cyclase/phosphodiesterase [Bradyrhizobium]|uniref:putative bifunctional diguanylate cyclase/phosphodiesterase n=1 Tax=Bradyrhizobium TaxID=374 RepID=UPI0004B2798D|nr:diguanylate cyclase (GGDEF)-like protein [Bradyrhizobium elkanii]MCS3560123.1 diguanylate cyclase (GGDEF)-like protein [Bradyrhizobium elkanii]MCW2150030.1 diguanylate cyclase (GGDEF)-like protein [Bradyrhizobium elkanii]MCW2359996.1 diguanylate cyclase (GGDEF)-like protein [Bradyrhizobium elkanii]MCW2373762.1 diguanylate cyclase (GGDEF)-like protein [Bradyrhizobium elkanii]